LSTLRVAVLLSLSDRAAASVMPPAAMRAAYRGQCRMGTGCISPGGNFPRPFLQRGRPVFV
jgi:hypothetical protein